jgi:hypothetical protein
MLARAVFLGIIALGASVMGLSVALAPAPKPMSATEIEQCSLVGEAAGVGIVEAHTYCRRFGPDTMTKVWASRTMP